MKILYCGECVLHFVNPTISALIKLANSIVLDENYEVIYD